MLRLWGSSRYYDSYRFVEHQNRKSFLMLGTFRTDWLEEH